MMGVDDLRILKGQFWIEKLSLDAIFELTHVMYL